MGRMRLVHPLLEPRGDEPRLLRGRGLGRVCLRVDGGRVEHGHARNQSAHHRHDADAEGDKLVGNGFIGGPIRQHVSNRVLPHGSAQRRHDEVLLGAEALEERSLRHAEAFGNHGRGHRRTVLQDAALGHVQDFVIGELARPSDAYFPQSKCLLTYYHGVYGGRNRESLRRLFFDRDSRCDQLKDSVGVGLFLGDDFFIHGSDS